jgi:hypothetical protein
VSKSRYTDLLRDIARLLAKYGPEPFEELAAHLSGGRFLNDLLMLLETSALAGRRSTRPLGRKRKDQRESKGLGSLLKQCEDQNPDKARALQKVYESLVSKRLLPTLRQIRDFAKDNGLPPIKATSRDKAIVPLVRGMISMPFEQIVSVLERDSHFEEKGDRTLEGWTNVILGRHGRAPREER